MFKKMKFSELTSPPTGAGDILQRRIKNIPLFWWVFLVIFLVGIFLRLWHHHDWLRFNADQGRDAIFVSNVVDGNAPLPLLGPKAGGTQFRLGPAFYWFEIASAKIFGNYPDKMAYPDLITSILCLPLLFFFLRKYFDKYTALSMNAIFAVSNYAIRYARFAWNPNSTPFWTILLLYAIHEIISSKNNRKFLWSAVAGIAIGIDVQLHTTLLVILPIATVLVFSYLAFKNLKNLKYLLVILFIMTLVNTPQLINIYQKKGRNIKLFLKGFHIKQRKEDSVLNNMLQGTSCWIQGNLYIISGYEISDECVFNPSHSAGKTTLFFFGLLFVLGGTILGIRYFLKEKNTSRKSFLGIVFVFVGITYLVFLKVAFELSVRFYLPLIFLPYLMLGFWIEFTKEKFKIRQRTILLAVLVPLILSNLCFVQKSFATLASRANLRESSVNSIILQEAEILSRFIVANSNDEKKVYIAGDKQFLHKAYTPLKYLVGRSGVELLLLKKNAPPPESLFQVVSQKKKKRMTIDPNLNISQSKDFGELSILFVQNKVSPP
jgi:4-amino-4-deoxy-L-arabinose transferase-like glycosyltransferase